MHLNVKACYRRLTHSGVGMICYLPWQRQDAGMGGARISIIHWRHRSAAAPFVWMGFAANTGVEASWSGGGRPWPCEPSPCRSWPAPRSHPGLPVTVVARQAATYTSTPIRSTRQTLRMHARILDDAVVPNGRYGPARRQGGRALRRWPRPPRPGRSSRDVPHLAHSCRNRL